jgi:hypothetical protein
MGLRPGAIVRALFPSNIILLGQTQSLVVYIDLGAKYTIILIVRIILLFEV